MMPERSHQDVTQLIAAVLAVHGGLNERAKRAILEIARSQGYGAREILSILEQVARHDHDATILAVTHAAEKSDPHDDHAHRNRMGVYFRANRAARITLAILTSSLFIASVILLVLSALTIRGMLPVASVDEARIVPPPRERAPQPGPLVNGQALQTQDVQDGSPPDASLYDVLLSPFDEAQDRFREIGGDALIPVAASIDHISQIWASLDRVSIEASSNRIANLLLVLEQGPSDHASRLLELVLIPSSHIRAGEPAHGRVLPAVWSVGIAMRLTKETYTDPVIRTQLEAHILKIFPPGDRPRQPSFRAGATAAVELLARGAIDTASKPFASTDTQIWNDLRRALLALAELKEQPTRDAVLRLIGYTLLTGPSSANSSATAETLATLIQLIDWSTRESGQALLGWFDDPELPTQSLSPFLRHLENEPTFPDISETQPLTPASPPIQRAHIRDQIANVYSLPRAPPPPPPPPPPPAPGGGGGGGGGGGARGKETLFPRSGSPLPRPGCRAQHRSAGTDRLRRRMTYSRPRSMLKMRRARRSSIQPFPMETSHRSHRPPAARTGALRSRTSTPNATPASASTRWRRSTVLRQSSAQRTPMCLSPPRSTLCRSRCALPPSVSRSCTRRAS